MSKDNYRKFCEMRYDMMLFADKCGFKCEDCENFKLLRGSKFCSLYNCLINIDVCENFEKRINYGTR